MEPADDDIIADVEGGGEDGAANEEEADDNNFSIPTLSASSSVTSPQAPARMTVRSPESAFWLLGALGSLAATQ